ncbi:hypothetical protein [Zhongshania borealis]|uniref:CopG family transcriptional regulator n=1 Tax=Zhongshania borealis TaxID=889488 RepID=A0ABP7WA22_9GAMM
MGYSKTPTVSVRFPGSEYAALCQEAEDQNINVSETLRRSWRQHHQAMKIEQQLLAMEQRLTRNIVETVFLACNLNTEEQADCKQKLAMIGVTY